MTLPRRTAALFLILLASCDAKSATTGPADAGPQPQSLPTIHLVINKVPFDLQVAKDDATREKGLMYVRQMDAGKGMIFVFPTEKPLDFWMKNTPIDLDIIYADHAGVVVSVKTMRAYDISNVPSDGPASFAIELNARAATKAGVTVGQVLDMPAGLLAQAR